MLKLKWSSAVAMMLAAMLAVSVMACGPAETVVKEVPVEKVVTETVIQTVEVPKEVVVRDEVVKEVEVEKIITQEVPVEKIVTKEVTREVVKEVQVEVEKRVEVPMQALEPLIVGHLNAFTGSLSYFGESHANSISLAADHINRAGGIQGGSVVLVHRDTGVNPVQGVSAAEDLVNVQGAVAIVGALASGVTIPVATSVTTPNGVVQISGSSTAPGITVLEDNDFLFRTALSDASQGVVLAELANELGYQSAGILFINNAYGEGLASQFTESFEAMGGMVTASVPHEDAQPTYVSELEKATEGDPDVLLAMSYQQAEVYLREALEGGYADTFMFVDGTKIPQSFEAIGWDLLEGSHGTGPGFEANPSTQAFIDSYKETYGNEPEPPLYERDLRRDGPHRSGRRQGWQHHRLGGHPRRLARSGQRSGEVVRPGVEGIREAMKLISEGRDVNYEGAAGSVDLDENGDVISGHIEVWKIEGGEIVSVRQVPVTLGQ